MVNINEYLLGIIWWYRQAVYIFNFFIGAAVPCLEYTCNNGECISMSYVCNKLEDCIDGSDEHGRCGKYSVKYSDCRAVCIVLHKVK